MTKTQHGRASNTEDVARKSKKEEDRELSEELQMSFPASDPPAATQPGSGITGPEVTKRTRLSGVVANPSEQIIEAEEEHQRQEHEGRASDKPH